MKVSIICPSFNHEKYIGFFIDSILKQTYQNFELIINDDCSVDETLKVLHAYKDNRIKILQNSINSGPNYSINEAFKYCSGDYIILCASDDMLDEQYLQTIVEIFSLNQSIGVIYSNLCIIDECNKKYDTHTLEYNNNTDKRKILSDFFYKGNTLFSPGMAIRHNVLEAIMPLDISFVNHQDFYMHIKLLSISDCFFIKQPLVLYRKELNNNTSLSNNINGKIRTELETYKIMNEFLNINVEFCKFICSIYNLKIIDNDLLSFYIGIAALHADSLEKKKWGYNQIMEYINYNGFYKINKLENFNFKQYLHLISQINYYDEISYEYDKIRKKYKKYKYFFKFMLFTNASLLMIIFWILYNV